MEIKFNMLENFIETEKDGINVNDLDIQLWTLPNVTKDNYQLKASDRYVQKFEKDFGITRRKNISMYFES